MSRTARLSGSVVSLFIAFSVFSLFAVVPSVSTVQSASLPLTAFTTKTCLTVNTPSGFFQNIPLANVTATHCFLPTGVFYYFNSLGGNASAGALCGKWDGLSSCLPLLTNNVKKNSTTFAFNFYCTASNPLCFGQSLNMTAYFKEQFVTVAAKTYPSTQMEVIFKVWSFSGANPLSISLTILSPNNVAPTYDFQSQRAMLGSVGFVGKDKLNHPTAFASTSNSFTFSWTCSSAPCTIDPTTITTTTAQNGVAYDFQRKTCHLANGRYVAAGSDGTSLLEYSATNAAFTTSVVSNSLRAAVTGQYFGTWCDTAGNKWGYAFASGGANLYVQAITINSDGTYGSVFAEVDISGQLPAGHNNLINYPSLYFSGTTDYWVVTADQPSGGNGFGDVLYCAGTCGTGTNWTNVKSYDWGAGSANDGSGMIIPLSTTAKKSLVLGRVTSTTLKLQTTTNSGTSWSTAQATTSSYTLNSCSAAYTATDTTSVACLLSSSVYYFNFGLAPASAPTETQVDTTNPTGGISISTDSSAKLAITFCTGTTVFTRRSADSGSTWGAQTSQTSAETSITYCGSSYALDSNSDIQTTWVGGSISPFNWRFLDSTITFTVTITGKCTQSPAGATQDVVALSGAGVSPTTLTCNASTSSLTVNSGQTVTATVGSAATNKHYFFNPAGTQKMTLTRSCSAACNWFFTDYLIDNITRSYSGTVATSPVLTGTKLGNATTTTLTATPTADFRDDGTAWTITKSGNFPSSTQRYDTSYSNSTASAGQIIAPVFYRQWSNQFAYSVSGGGTPTAPTFTANLFGASTQTALTTTLASIWVDDAATCTVTNPTGGSTSTERWSTQTSCPTTSAGGSSTTFAYYHQYSATASYSVVDALGVCSAPVLTYTVFGAAGTTYTLTTTGTAKWVDAGTSATSTNPLTGSTASERCVVATASFTVSSAITIAPAYKHQYKITNAGALTITRTNNGTSADIASTSFFFDATTSITVKGIYARAWSPTVASWIYDVTAANIGIQVLGDQAISAIMYTNTNAQAPFLTFTTVTSCRCQGFIPSGSNLGVLKVTNNGINNGAYTFTNNLLDETGASPHEWDFSLIPGGAPSGGTSTSSAGGGGAVLVIQPTVTTPTVPAPVVKPPPPPPPDYTTIGILVIVSIVGIATALGLRDRTKFKAPKTSFGNPFKGPRFTRGTFRLPKPPSNPFGGSVRTRRSFRNPSLTRADWRRA